MDFSIFSTKVCEKISGSNQLLCTCSDVCSFNLEISRHGVIKKVIIINCNLITFSKKMNVIVIKHFLNYNN